jgi:hypothetical protein
MTANKTARAKQIWLVRESIEEMDLRIVMAEGSGIKAGLRNTER